MVLKAFACEVRNHQSLLASKPRDHNVLGVRNWKHLVEDTEMKKQKPENLFIRKQNYAKPHW